SFRLLLVSNQIRPGEEDRSPIRRALIEKIPDGVKPLPTPINFEDKIELVAWRTTPTVPRPGSPLSIELFWRAKKRVSGDWKIFVHIDSAGQRIHGDHAPVEGLLPTSDWKVGDLVRDEHHLNVKRTIAPGRFTFYVGLYRGNTRMKIRNSERHLKDNENRAKIGQLWVR
ncbi:MAG: hypothetical protein VYD19_08950, partial [Myxococcota bacterium]|nr:hypothetical protein [Myxococcota bacterium]